MHFVLRLLSVAPSASLNATGVLPRKIAAFAVTVAKVHFGQVNMSLPASLPVIRRLSYWLVRAFLHCEVTRSTPGAQELDFCRFSSCRLWLLVLMMHIGSLCG